MLFSISCASGAEEMQKRLLEERPSGELLPVWKEWGGWQREVWLQAGNAEDGCLKEGWLVYSYEEPHSPLESLVFLKRHSVRG